MVDDWGSFVGLFGFCFVVVPYVFLAILAFAFVFLWGCLVHVVFIHVLGFLYIQVFLFIYFCFGFVFKS